MTTDNAWHSGPPPSIGWWPASNDRIPGVYRWYNGEWWSGGVYSGVSAAVAAILAEQRDRGQLLIEWQHRPDDWPERSRT